MDGLHKLGNDSVVIEDRVLDMIVGRLGFFLNPRGGLVKEIVFLYSSACAPTWFSCDVREGISLMKAPLQLIIDRYIHSEDGLLYQVVQSMKEEEKDRLTVLDTLTIWTMPNCNLMSHSLGLQLLRSDERADLQCRNKCVHPRSMKNLGER